MNSSKRLSPNSMLSTAAIAIASLFMTAVATAAPIVSCPDTGVAQSQIDLTDPDDTTTINAAIFTAIDTNGTVGTGVFPALVKVQGNDCIHGYNTQGTEEFDTQNNSSEIIRLDTMMVVTEDGIDYVEFHLDINQNKNNDAPSGPSLDNVQIFVAGTNDLTGWTDCLLGGIACVYNMDEGMNRAILLDYVLNNGGGNGYDMKLLVPVSVFGAALADPANNYVYLYSSFGAVGGNFAENDGFEEWQYRVCPPDTVCVREPPPPDTNVPEPASIALVGLGLLALAAGRRKRIV